MDMNTDYVTITSHLLVALVAGALIGYERSYQGRPAGFRTHTLVCMASALLMLLTVFQSTWFIASAEVVRVDPTRMAQGIMTGIGFLGAGVIVKEGATVRGLTTAASIWITAAIGILAGVGFYYPVVLVTVLTLGTLSMFRWIEARMPTWLYLRHTVRFAVDRSVPESEYTDFIADQHFRISEFSYHLDKALGYVEYRMVMKSRTADAERRLALALTSKADILAFTLTPAGD
ncbi:MAG: putative transport ATPase [Betaproteobacteria bacterium]|jgi:putative Mg2+ transporter-C (MgtC) family protein|nr:putative transport ATPase [Betaproteobacteria bacterium]